MKMCYNFHCNPSVGDHCSCRVVVCTPCHSAVSLGSLHHKHNDTLPATANVCLESPDGDVQPPGDVNASEIDEPADEPASDILDGGTELLLLSKRQCRLIYQQFRKSDVCLEESFSALMHGTYSVRLCVLEVCATRDSRLTIGDRKRLHEISAAERWTSRDHDLSKSAGRRSSLQTLDAVRPEHAVFFHHFSGSQFTNSNGRRSDKEIHCLLVHLVGSKKNCPLEMRMSLSNVCLAH